MKASTHALMWFAIIATVACGRDPEVHGDTMAAREPRLARISDAGIVGTLDAINSSEVAVSRLVAAKTTNADVRAYAEQLIRDHEQLQRSGMTVARDHDIKPEETTDAAAIRARGKSLIDTLNTLAGQPFDLTYIDAQVADHQMALQALHGWQRFAKDSDLRSALRNAWPVVQAHYDHAMALLPGLIPAGESSVWKKHLGMPDAASGKPASQKVIQPTP